MSLQVITIDFWNTLFSSANGEDREQHRLQLIRQYAERVGVRLTPQQLTAVRQQTWAEFKRIWRTEHRTPTTQELVRYLWQQLGLAPQPALIEELAHELAHGILEHPPELLPGARDTLEYLAGHFRLALISDTAFSPGTILRQVMENAGIAEFFSAFSFSDQTGVAKPHPEAYHSVLRQLNVDPQQALHIGDIEHTDIAGAKSLGMYAILFRGDDNSIFSEESQPQQSRADAIVYQWQEIPEVIHTLERNSQ